MTVYFCSGRTFNGSSILMSHFGENGSTFSRFDLGGGVTRLIVDDSTGETRLITSVTRNVVGVFGGKKMIVELQTQEKQDQSLP